MAMATKMLMNRSEEVATVTNELKQTIQPDVDKYKLIELLKLANEYNKPILGDLIFKKFQSLLADDLTAIYLDIKFNAMNSTLKDQLGNINTLLSEAHYLNYKQEAIILGIKGYIISTTSNIPAGKDLVEQGLKIDDNSYFCYYFLAQIDKSLLDEAGYQSNLDKATKLDVNHEIVHED